MVRAALEALEERERLSWVRLYDSKSSGVASGGNFIPAQPCDFIACLNGRPSIIEVKSSYKHSSLSSETLRSIYQEEQIAGARLWNRAKANTLSVFVALPTRTVEIWDTMDIVRAYLSPPRKRKLGIDKVCSYGVGADLTRLLYFQLV